jgi:hypothetical protein
VVDRSLGDLPQVYNNLPGGVFYVDKTTGKWNMRPI